ncbi:MAG: hypothetical protein ACF8LL_11035 [Phycisphaerales bacterium]
MIHAHTRQPALAILVALSCALGACGDAGTDHTGKLRTTRVLGEAGKHNGQFVYPRGMDIFDYNGSPHAITVDKTARPSTSTSKPARS